MISWTPVAPSDTLEVETLAEAFKHQQYLKGLLFQRLGINVDLRSLDLSRGVRVIPFASMINIIEHNLDTLFMTWRPIARKESVEWLGELLDQRLLDYTDVNRWFEMMQLLEKLIEAFSLRVPVTGTFRTGTNRTRQVVKRSYLWNYILSGSWELGEKPFATYR